ncbi:unnamed protein product [Withania somnifera]
MKSPTKHEEGIEIPRKIRVKILDPDATESSSDDEQEKRPKFIVHEITQEKVKIQSFPQNNKTPYDFYQFFGKLPPMIRKRKCGKFAPVEKLIVAKKAKDVVSAKSEIGSGSDPPLVVDSCFDQCSGKLPPMVRKRKCRKFSTEEKLKVVKNAIVKKSISAKYEIGSSSSDPPLMVNSQTLDLSKVKCKLPPRVRKRKSGKFTTEIRHPFSKKRIWLGTFDTPKEASEVYQSKKLEFEKLKARNTNVKKAISAKSFDTADEGSMVHQSKKLEFEKLKKDKNANVKKVVSANPFDTAEEASEVYQSTKLEFEGRLKMARNANVKKVISAKSESGSSSRKSLNFDRKLPHMVSKRKSGKFGTEIKDPFSKKRIWLGTFDTAEEASEVYQSKKLEFEKLKKAKNANVKKAISAKFELGSSCSSDPPLMVDSQTSDSLNELGDLLRKAINANVTMVISAKPEFGHSSCSDPPLTVDCHTSDSLNEFDERLKKAISAKEKKASSAKSALGSSSSDPSLVVDAQNSDSSNGQESEEEMWMGQWIRISGDKEVKFSRKLGVPVVDNYGFLLGEFSELDDLSISCLK